MSCTAPKRTVASGLDNLKRASVVCKTRRKWLFVPILVRSSIEAEPAPFRVTGSIRSSVVAFSSARLDEEDRLILVTEVETILQECCEDDPDVRMTALG